MRAALDRVDVVGEREDGLLVGVVPLHRDLDGALVGFALEVDDVLVDRVLRLVDVGDEVLDAALVVELDGLPVRALVDELDVQALRQEGRLAETLHHGAGLDVELLEDLGVGQEGDLGSRVVGLADDRELALRHAACKLLPVELAVASHLGDEPLRERVHDRDADAVQAAGDLVAVAAELAACVELRQDDGERRLALALHDVDRDARAPVADGHGVVGMERHLDPVVPAREGLVDRVVDDLVDEVVEAPEARRADVHARPETDRLEPLEDGDVFCCIGRFGHEKSPANSAFAGTSEVYQNDRSFAG